jgi:hypothetical protein
VSGALAGKDERRHFIRGGSSIKYKFSILNKINEFILLNWDGTDT